MYSIVKPPFCTIPSQDGLAQQLLGVVVGHERPDLEASRLELVASMSSNRALLAGLEDTLLRELSSATGEGAGRRRQWVRTCHAGMPQAVVVQSVGKRVQKQPMCCKF